MNVYCIVVERWNDDGPTKAARLVEASYPALAVQRGLQQLGLAHVTPLTVRVTLMARNKRARDFDHMKSVDVLEWFDRVLSAAQKKRPAVVGRAWLLDCG